jgi:hypothetical protein
MTDRELLEAAAKAAGIHPRVVGAEPGLYWLDDVKQTAPQWNPLTDDGDALRLAVKLGLYIVFGDICVIVDGYQVHAVKNEGEQPAATRRAIVQAAARLQS